MEESGAFRSILEHSGMINVTTQADSERLTYFAHIVIKQKNRKEHLNKAKVQNTKKNNYRMSPGYLYE